MTYAQIVMDRTGVVEAIERETLEQNVSDYSEENDLDTEDMDTEDMDTEDTEAVEIIEPTMATVAVDRKRLQIALTNLKVLTGGRKTIAILGSVKIESTGTGEVTLEATDLEVGARYRLATESGPRTESAVGVTSLKPLLDVVRGLKDPTVTISTDENNVILEHGHGIARFGKDKAFDFPVFIGPYKDSKQTDFSTIPAAELRQLIERTAYAVSGEDTGRYSTGNALMIVRESGSSMVATDGHRLSVADCTAGESIEDARFMVHKSALTNLQKALKGTDGDISIERWAWGSGKKTAFSSNSWTVAFHEYDGAFPDWERVMPKNSNRTFKANGSILDAIKRVNGGQKTEPVPSIKIELTEGLIGISTTDGHNVQASELLEVGWEYDDVEIGFNPHLLMDFLKTVKDQDVTWQFSDGASVVLLRTNDYRYVVMPVRL